MTSKARILVVDDNISFCRTMSSVLSRKGFEVTITTSGPDALQQISTTPFDIVFMDIKMPSMNGVEAFKRIKEINPHTIVIMMTGYAVENLVEEALGEGAYSVLHKPFDFEDVLTLIDSIVNIDQGILTLMVDDDPSTCTLFRNVLMKKGYPVGIAHTGEEAIAMANERHYDVIFIDMKLPTINGLETYFSIKKSNPQTVFIIITAYHQEMKDLITQALNDSVYTWFQKPLDMEEVLELMDHVQHSKGGG
ncbi:MAG: response regulator [Theionarchaea archaeon]|nr:response regulator [Theionarchaea archaeon]